MRLPFLQMESDLLAHGAPQVAALAGCTPVQALGHIAFLRAWAVAQASDEAPPDGWARGPDASDAIEAAAQWGGEPGRFLRALKVAKLVAVTSEGVQVLGLEPYRVAWAKNAKAKQRMANLRNRSSNVRAEDAEHADTQAERSAKFGGQMQMQTEDVEAERPPSGDPRVPPRAANDSEDFRPPRTAPVSTVDAEAAHAPGDAAPSLWERLCATWAEIRPGRGPYPATPDGGPTRQDAKPLADLLGLGAQVAGHGRAAEEEIHRRWTLALQRTAFPRCDKLAHLRDNWTSYAAPEPERGAPPPVAGRDVGRGEAPEGNCAVCPRPAETRLRQHPVCYSCLATAQQEIANFTDATVSNWVQQARGRAA